jgi:hypothetical protein
MTTGDLLRRGVHAQIGGSAADWFSDATQRAARGPVAELLKVYTAASRHLGRTPLALEGLDSTAHLAAFPFSHWTLEDAGRLVMLLARHEASATSTGDWASATIACYEQGDTREQQSWLRGVALLPAPAQFLPVVIDACRTSIVPLFEAAACENPYPGTQFPERNFNQLVLKALFNGIALNRIVGLESRLNPELSRMASDYADERRAAGRSIPPDISLAMLSDMAAQRTDR